MLIKNAVSYLENKFKFYNFFLSEKSKVKSIRILKIGTFSKNGNGFRIFFIIHLTRSPKSSHFAISCIWNIYTIFTSSWRTLFIFKEWLKKLVLESLFVTSLLYGVQWWSFFSFNTPYIDNYNNHTWFLSQACIWCNQSLHD